MTDQHWSPAKQDPSAIPFRNKFDGARDPLTARNAIGAVDAKYVTDTVTDAIDDIDAASIGAASSTDFPAGAWTAWVPTVTSTTGALTSYTVNRARYTTAGKTITAHFDVTITNVGTGNGALRITLPVTVSASGGGMAIGQETVNTGYLIGGALGPSSTLMSLVGYLGQAPVGTNGRYVGIAVYEKD